MGLLRRSESPKRSPADRSSSVEGFVALSPMRARASAYSARAATTAGQPRGCDGWPFLQLPPAATDKPGWLLWAESPLLRASKGPARCGPAQDDIARHWQRAGQFRDSGAVKAIIQSARTDFVSCAALLCFIAHLYLTRTCSPQSLLRRYIPMLALAPPALFLLSAVFALGARAHQRPAAAHLQRRQVLPPSMLSLKGDCKMWVACPSPLAQLGPTRAVGPPRINLLNAAATITAAPAMPAAPTSCSVTAGRPASAPQTSSTRSSSASPLAPIRVIQSARASFETEAPPSSNAPFADAPSAIRSSSMKALVTRCRWPGTLNVNQPFLAYLRCGRRN